MTPAAPTSITIADPNPASATNPQITTSNPTIIGGTGSVTVSGYNATGAKLEYLVGSARM